MSFETHRIAASDGTELYVTTEGEGEIDFLLCDGLGCDGFIWRYLRPEMLRYGRIIHLHMRGHGRSEMPRTNGTIEIRTLADDWRPVLDRFQTRHGVVLGHSLGVQVALEVWHRIPDPIVGLGLFCGSFEDPTSTFRDTPYMRPIVPLLRKATKLGGRPLKKLWTKILNLPATYHVAKVGDIHPDLMQRSDFRAYIEHMAQLDPEIFLRAAIGAANHSARSYLPQIDVPTLVIGGESDTFTPARLSRELSELVPDAQCIVVDEGTHTVPLEHPTKVAFELEGLMHRVRARIAVPAAG